MTTQTKTSSVLIAGNTFPVKEQLKSMGGRWDAVAKGWRVPADKAAEARKLVAGAPRSQSAGKTYPSRRAVRRDDPGYSCSSYWCCRACGEENRPGASRCWECGCGR